MEVSARTPLEQRVIARMLRRLMPILMICYFVAYLDRVNVGFASLTMNKDLGLSASAFGLGAGIFFFGYFLFEVPSNMALARFGARRWIARIMIGWGILSCAMAFIWDAQSFYVVRLLLGLAEAGFFPGIILYLTYWFPQDYRARIVGWFMVAIPISSVIGSPVSSGILTLADGGAAGLGGLHGWQWLFLLEGLPAVIMGVVVLRVLTDRPEQADWLDANERSWLSGRLAEEHRRREEAHGMTLFQALTDWQVLALAAVYFGGVCGLYSLGFWLPQIVKGFGLSTFDTGLVVAIPHAIGAIGMVAWSKHSDRANERRWHTAIAGLVACLGFGLTPFVDGSVAKLVTLSIAGLGVYGALPVFWALPTAFLTGAAAAAGIALINALGNLAGYVGPQIIGLIKDRTGSFDNGLLFVAAMALMAAVIVVLLPNRRVAWPEKPGTKLGTGIEPAPLSEGQPRGREV